MASYSGMSMPELHRIASTEPQNIPSIQAGIQTFDAALAVLGATHGGVSGANSQLSAEWVDRHYPGAMGSPVEEGLSSIAKSQDIISGSGVQQALQNLIGQIQTTAKNVQAVNEQWLALQALLEQLLAMSGALGATVAPMIAAIRAQMAALRLEAVSHVEAEAQAYEVAGDKAIAAGSGHSYNGPLTAAGPSTGSAAMPAPRPPDTVTSFAPTSGDAAAAAQAAQLTQAQLDAARAAAEAGAGTADTGLAGGVATALPPATTIPPVSTPPAIPSAPAGTPPVGVPLGGAVPVARTGGRVGGPIPVAAAIGRQAGGTSIPSAAKVTGGITSASVGQAPALPAESAGGGRTSSRGASGMPMGAVPPMLAAPLAGDKLRSLIRRLKPVVTQHGTPAGGRAAGVPNALRGRSRTDVDDAFVANGPRARRSRKEQDDSPETLQLLDEELWQVEQARTARTAG